MSRPRRPALPVAGRSQTGGALVLAVILLSALALMFGCNGNEAGIAASPTSNTVSVGPTTTSGSAPSTTATASTSTTAGSETVSGGGDTSRTTVTYADPTATDDSAAGVTGALAESNALARELKRTLNEANKRVESFGKAGSDPADPAGGEIYVLRARGQALVSRRAIVDGQLQLADDALRECTKLLARAKPVPEDTAALTAAAIAALSQTPAPSQNPQLAASYLDEVIQTLAPLVEPQSTSGTT